MKKNIFTITLLTFAVFSSAQVAIGKPSVTNTSVSLEFGNTGSAADRSDATKQKGIILPWVSTLAAQPTSEYTAMTATENGTMIFDLSDYKIKYKVPASVVASGWFDLTVKNKTETITGIANNQVDSSLQDTKTELTNAKAAIGTTAATDNTEGILVLTDTNKAMVLPLVDKYSSVIAPSAGMMVYDLSNDMLCLYNGTVWSFWKP
ncbi:hypothetical protein ASG31_10375 [Chryseobacterium sp. Leaf404]|uniref:hypothetical protein n=1 Tax=unclassified Chryseobacterium TaxID=2593645 RepID=UPI0007000145|nr:MULTISPECIES: hypothetical protein [unclassified Chryseobacterium]KQT16776.1 hypothetical protein ASG31_10375 [Chryseobacterium sp. Leaf404]